MASLLRSNPRIVADFLIEVLQAVAMFQSLTRGFFIELYLGTQMSILVRKQALKYRLVTDIVQPICEIFRRREETTGHSVQPT